MLPQKLRLGLAIFFITLITSYHLLPLHAEPASEKCETLLNEPSSGNNAISKLGDKIEQAAQINSLTIQELSGLLKTTPTFNLDMCGKGFYAESIVMPQVNPLPEASIYLPAILAAKTPITSIGVTVNYDSVFNLHSDPTSTKTIYLDFDGERIADTTWNKNFNNGQTWVAAGFSQDKDFTKFSESELMIIQSVWQRVAEDFAAFDIDVTTEKPLSAALERESISDNIFGTRALISNDTVIFEKCKCSGLAYVGVFDSIGKLHDINQPAWIFTQGVGDNPKYIAEAVTHEIGHTLGLSHDGSKSSSYFAGSDGWAPIMGVGFFQPVTQWSKGEYQEADNLEDDFAVMQSYGLRLRVDEDQNSEESARAIKENQSLGGVIAAASDKDYFLFTPKKSSDYLFAVSTATLSPNLDVNFTLYPINKISEKVVINPPLVVNGADVIQGLSVRYSRQLKSGTSYILVIDGQSASNSSRSAFTNYGSIGTYKFTITVGNVTDKPVVTASPVIDQKTATLPEKLINPASVALQPLVLPVSKVKGRLGSRFIRVQ